MKRKYIELIYVISIFLIPIYFFSHLGQFMSRVPGQDFYINDLWLLHKIRFIQDTYANSGIYGLITSSIDFFQGTGESIFSSSKFYFYVLNPLNITYLIFDPETSIKIKSLIYCFLCIGGIFNLVNTNNNLKNFYERILIIVLLSSSFLASNIFISQSSLLNQSFLYLVPFYLYSLKKIFECYSSKYLLYIILLTLLAVGDSDIFIFFNIFSLFIFFTLSNLDKYKQIILLSFLIFLIILFAYIPYLFENFYYKSNIHSKGSWDIEEYYNYFIKDLIFTIFSPYFSGPASLYVNTIIIFLTFFNFWQFKINFIFVKKFFFLTISFILLLLIGILLHFFLKNILPSAVRYHLNIFPFILLCILAEKSLFWNINKKFYYSLFLVMGFIIFYEFAKFSILDNLSINYAYYVCLFFIFFLIAVTSFNNKKYYTYKKILFIIFVPFFFKGILYNNDGDIVPNKNFGIYQKDAKAYHLKTLPQCINQTLEKYKNSISRSVIFAGINDNNLSEKRIEDYNLILITEIPHLINSRTFNRWRYNINVLEQNLTNKHNLQGLFAFAYPLNEIKSVTNFADDTLSSILITNHKFEDTRWKYEGTCKNQIANNKFIKTTNGNYIGTVKGQRSSLANDTLIYSRNKKSDNYILKIFSNKIVLKIDNKKIDFIPINFHPHLRSNSKFEITGDKSNFTKIKKKNEVEIIEIFSFTYYNFLIIFFTLILIILIFIFNTKKFSTFFFEK
jgi:hypothetical protein